MKVFSHHLYEYRKGLRNLILHTTLAQHRSQIEARLVKHGVAYVIYALGNGRINVFFGADECVEAIRRIGKPCLTDYTPEEDFMLGIMLGYDRLAQCRRYLVRSCGHVRPSLPEGRCPGVWREPKSVRVTRAGFTLMELLIVLGILGALATLLLSNYTVDRTETLDNSIVQKELSDIQAAFQRLESDCVLQPEDYQLISRYGLAVLMEHGCLDGENWSFDASWNADQGKGWRGPYIEEEARRAIGRGDDPISTSAQSPDSGEFEVPVVCTPYAEGGNDGHFYRVVPKLDGDGVIEQLWVVFPGNSGVMTGIPDLNSSDADEQAAFEEYPYKRRLLLHD